MSTLWLAVLYLHLIAMAFFVGGQIMLAAAIVPVERRSPDPTRMRAIARRFGYGSLLALAVLLSTGIAMATRFRLWESGTLHLKLALVVAVIALVLVHMRRPHAHALSAVIFLASLAIVWLGLELSR
jgi:putative copper export protein